MTLRERIEGLITSWREPTSLHPYRDEKMCAAELAAALAAEVPGEMPPAYPKGNYSQPTAPSLHEEELDFGTPEEVIAGLDAINKHNAVLHKEGAGGDDVQVRLDRIAANVERAVHESYARDAVRREALEEIRKEAIRLKRTETALSRGWYGAACDDIVRFIDVASPAGRAEPDAQLMDETYEDYLKRAGRAEEKEPEERVG